MKTVAGTSAAVLGSGRSFGSGRGFRGGVAMATASTGSRLAGLLAAAIIVTSAATAAAVTTMLLLVVTTTAATTAIVSMAAAIAAAATTVATMATMTGDGSLLTAQQGDAKDRDQNRDAKEQSTVHPQILQKRYRNVRVLHSRPTFSPPVGTASERGGTSTISASLLTTFRLAALDVSLYGLSSLDTNAQSRLLN